MTGWTLGVIGGSGLDALPGLQDVRRERIVGPWGEPSGELVIGRLGAVTVVFLARHGAGHRLNPSEINHRANIDALKRAGCTDLLSLSAVGSLQEHLPPGTFVVVDQYVDRTVGRPCTFFEGGIVAHVSLAAPVCPRVSRFAADAARAVGAPVVQGGTYLCMEGPQFSTRAESALHRSWGCDVVGMTNMPEARLAREAELPYASVCMVTDWDCWRAETEAVEVAAILSVMRDNAVRAQALIRALAEALPARRDPSPIDTTLDGAIVTPHAARDAAAVARLDAVAGRALRSSAM